MFRTVYTEDEVAAKIHRSRRWLLDWLRDNPTDTDGRPLFMTLGRSKRFHAEDIVRIVDIILTQKEKTEKPVEGGRIYFIDGGDAVKIGYSRSLISRMKEMSTDAPVDVQLLHIEPGTFRQEKVLHRHFKELRLRGEWFRKTPELMDFIEQRKQIYGRP